VSSRSPTVVWRVSSELVRALDDRLGAPLDGYVNGTQSWLTDDGPGDQTLEWRLHPVGGYAAPRDASPYEVFDEVVGALGAGAPADAVPIGGERRALTSLWEGLECFAAYGDEMEPAVLAAAAARALGIPPDATGLVDHTRIGEAWERSGRQTSITDLLFEELGASR
jgi:hypothetical protein